MTTPASPISNTERQHLLLALLTSQQRITVPEICERFSVSEATARRDLELLAEQGLIQRVHGGAIAVRRAAPELSILARDQEQADEKSRIGKAAAALIGDGETVFLGSGTTVLEVARNLAERRNLTVITNSLPVLNLLAGRQGVSVIALGGMLRDSELSFIGHLTEMALGEVNADRVIIGIRAINLENGLTNDYLPETMTDRAILRAGREVVVVADHTKCGVVSTAFVAPLTNVQKLVTDEKTPAAFISALKDQGIDVTIV